jgi:hypothetical protein
MGLSSIVSRIVPVAVGFATGGPVGATKAAFTTEVQKRKESRAKRSINRFNTEQELERQKMAEFSDTDVIYSNSSTGRGLRVNRGGFGESFGNFLGDFGQNILNPLGTLFSSPVLQPFISAQSRGQPAQPTQGAQRGQESARSGTQEAFVGGAGNILGQAARFLRTPAGSLTAGGALGLAGSLFDDTGKKVRITRKMKSQFRSVLNLNMGNYELAADMVGVSTDFFISVLLKRFRNDGPVVTKAALRKTKTTVRRLKNMCDMYDSLRPTATRRRTPMKRASTTLISNK